MIRLTSAPPTPYNLALLREQAFATWPQLIDLNELDGGAEIAFYFPDGNVPAQGDVATFLAAHDGTQKSVGQLAQEQRNAIAGRLETASSAVLDATPLGQVVHDTLRHLGLKDD